MAVVSGMKVAICGTRGIPACYGGFETFAEELSVRLRARGHEVVVYGRSHVIKHDGSRYRDVEIRLISAPRHKYLETPVHSLWSFIDLLRRRLSGERIDVVLLCNAANSPFAWLPRLGGLPVVINVDGIERKRKKWNALGRLWYRLGELCSVLFASEIVSDAEVIREYYEKHYRTDSVVIRYGARDSLLKGADLRPQSIESPTLRKFNLSRDNYILYVSRLEPENNAHVVIEGYSKLNQELREKFPLVIVGDAPYASEYIASLKSAAGDGVIFTGYQFGLAYEELQLAAACYIQASEVGGTHPALLEAMGAGNCVIANSTPEHSEVLEEAGIYYRLNDPEDLARHIKEVLTNPDLRLRQQETALKRAKTHFSWDAITDEYEALFRKFAER